MKFTILLALCICQAYADLNLSPWGIGSSSSSSSTRCATDEYKCNSGQCIKKAYLCDGDRDCPGGEDERSCRGGSTMRTTARRATSSPDDEECGAGEFDCGAGGAGRYGRCIPNSPTFMCDGARDCGNGADERNCRQTTTESSSSRGSCKTGEFQCGSGRCLKQNWVCDGDMDCADGEDEQNCRGGRASTTRARSTSPVRRSTLSTRGTTTTLKPLHLNGLKVVTGNSNRLWYKPAASKEECADLCAARAKCRLSQFDKTRKVCTAYAEDVNAKFALDEDFSTYGRWTETATRYPGSTISGTDISYDGQQIADWLKIQWTEQICTQICHVHPKCDLALWNTKTNKCALKTHAASYTTTSNPNVVATVLEDDNDSRSPSPSRY